MFHYNLYERLELSLLTEKVRSRISTFYRQNVLPAQEWIVSYNLVKMDNLTLPFREPVRLLGVLAYGFVWISYYERYFCQIKTNARFRSSDVQNRYYLQHHDQGRDRSFFALLTHSQLLKSFLSWHSAFLEDDRDLQAKMQQESQRSLRCNYHHRDRIKQKS